MLLRTVFIKIRRSLCVTIPTCSRKDARVTSRTSHPVDTETALGRYRRSAGSNEPACSFPTRRAKPIATTSRAANFEVNVNAGRSIRALAAISEAYAIELDGPRESGQALGMRLLANIVLDVHKLEDLAGSAKGLLEIIIESRKLGDGVIQSKTAAKKATKPPLIISDMLLHRIIHARHRERYAAQQGYQEQMSQRHPFMRRAVAAAATARRWWRENQTCWRPP